MYNASEDEFLHILSTAASLLQGVVRTLYSGNESYFAYICLTGSTLLNGNRS